MASRKYLTCPECSSNLVEIVGTTVALKVYRRSDGGIAHGPFVSSLGAIKAIVQRDHPEGTVIRDEDGMLICDNPGCAYEITVEDFLAPQGG